MEELENQKLDLEEKKRKEAENLNKEKERSNLFTNRFSKNNMK